MTLLLVTPMTLRYISDGDHTYLDEGGQGNLKVRTTTSDYPTLQIPSRVLSFVFLGMLVVPMTIARRLKPLTLVL